MHYRRYNLKNLKALIINSGFKIKYISYYNSFLFPPIALVRIIFNTFNLDSDNSVENKMPGRFINTTLYRIFKAEEKIIASNHKFPFGVSLIAVLEL